MFQLHAEPTEWRARTDRSASMGCPANRASTVSEAKKASTRASRTKAIVFSTVMSRSPIEAGRASSRHCWGWLDFPFSQGLQAHLDMAAWLGVGLEAAPLAITRMAAAGRVEQHIVDRAVVELFELKGHAADLRSDARQPIRLNVDLVAKLLHDGGQQWPSVGRGNLDCAGDVSGFRRSRYNAHVNLHGLPRPAGVFEAPTGQLFATVPGGAATSRDTLPVRPIRRRR